MKSPRKEKEIQNLKLLSKRMSSWAEQLDELKKSESLRTITVPLIVPTNQELLDNKDLDLSFSPLNACYSKPVNGKEKSWYDVRLTINGEDNLPSRKDWFYLMTDNGYFFKACFSGRGKQIKWLNSFEDKEMIGDWIKTRLVNWDLIEEYKYASEDTEGYGIITKEVLNGYGGDRVYLKKTTKTKKDSKGIERDVWLISFPYSLVYS